MPVVAARWRGFFAFGRIEQLQCLRSAFDRRLADFVAMGKSGHLARHAAQAKAAVSAVVGGLQTAIVKTEALNRAILQIEFTIVASRQAARDQRFGALRVETIWTI